MRSLRLAALSSLLAAGLWGQIPQIDQEQNLRKPPPQQQPDDARSLGELSTGVAPSSPGDADLGEQVILKRQQKATPWTFTAETSINATSNIGLVDRGAQSDSFFLGQMALSYQRKLRENVLLEATVSQGFFRYNKFTAFDFDSLNAGLGATWYVKGLALSARYNYNRLTDGSRYREFFRQHSATLGVQKTISLNSAVFTYFGGTARINWNEPLNTQRDEYALYIGGRAAITRSFTLDAFYRAALFAYNFPFSTGPAGSGQTRTRRDVNQTLSLALRYQPKPWLSASVSTSFGLNSSNTSPFDYRVANGGLTLGVLLRF
ncbi:MAG: hypothetical protein JSR82_04215 [Verrucomicrobia bacterium]|nr:hypothetical protein [Verrucomicrobiota bacterium]